MKLNGPGLGAKKTVEGFFGGEGKEKRSVFMGLREVVELLTFSLPFLHLRRRAPATASSMKTLWRLV